MGVTESRCSSAGPFPCPRAPSLLCDTQMHIWTHSPQLLRLNSGSCAGSAMGSRVLHALPRSLCSPFLFLEFSSLAPKGSHSSFYESVNGPVFQIFFSPVFYFFSIFCLFPSGWHFLDHGFCC